MPNFFADLLKTDNKNKVILSLNTKTQTSTPQTTKAVSPMEKAGNFFADIIHSTARSGGAVGLTLATPFIGTQEIKSEDLSGTELKFKEAVFGKEPVKSIQQRVAETELTLKEKGLPITGTKLPSGLITPLSLLGVGAVIALDFTGQGGEKNTIKVLTKLNKVDEVADVLKKINVVDDLIKEYAPKIAKTADKLEVEKIISHIDDLQKTTKATSIAQKGVKEAIPAEKGIIPKELEPLAQEARKYGSAEDFVNNQQKVFRAGEPFNKSKMTDFGISVGRKKTTAEIFGGKTRGIEELFIDKNAKILKDIPNSIKIDENFDENIIRYAKGKGFDGIDISSKGVDELRIINSNTLKTKSQLTDIYNQAVGGGSKEKQVGQKLPQLGQEASSALKKLTEQKQISELLPPQSLGVSLPVNIPQKENAVNRIIKALKETKPIRAGQEAIYSAEKAKQTARIAAMGKKVPGEAGYFAQLGQLKGKMPQIQFESIRKEISQPAIDELFNTIEKNSILSPFEKINAKTGLSKLLGAEGGTIPTKGELDLLSEIFPDEFVKTILDKRPLMQKFFDTAGSALNLPRAVMATADLSAPMRQGVFLIGRPKQFLPAFKDMFKYAFSEKAYVGLMEGIKTRPTYKLMRESGLSLTEMGSNLMKREEAFMSNLAERIPIFGKLVRGSNRAYSGFLNKLRADVFDDLVKNAQKQGLLKNNSKMVDDIARFVNSATGRGDLGTLNRASVALNATFFSPRLIASRVNLLNPLYYAKLEPFVRKEALKSLLSFGATAGSVLALAKMGGAEIGIDPRSADFGKIKIGNTRYDVLGGFQQYMVLISRLLSGQMVSSTTGKEFTLGEGYKPTTRVDIIQRFFESKLSPVFSFAEGLLKGQNTMGEKFNVNAELADRFIPMVIQDMYDLYRENGLAGLGMGIPGVFGVGSQTYSDTIPLETKTATGKPTIEYRQQPSLGETILNKIIGKTVEPIPVKAKYDEVQLLLSVGKDAEARAIVNSLSENDYALYKKLKEKANRIKSDETKARITPVYKNVRKLIEEGKTSEAQKIVDSLTDEEYKAYQSIKSADYKIIQ